MKREIAVQNSEIKQDDMENSMQKREFSKGECFFSVSERKASPEEKERGVATFEEDRICEIVIKNKDGKELKLNDLMPNDWLIVSQENNFFTQAIIGVKRNIQAGQYHKVVSYPKNVLIPRFKRAENISNPTKDSKISGKSLMESMFYESHDFLKMKGSLLGILHEIGHANAPKLEGFDELNSFNLRVAGGMAEKGGKQDLMNQNEEIIMNYFDLVMKEERDAWAYAISKYRELLKQGFDLEPDMSYQDLFSCIEVALSSYRPTAFVEKFEQMRRSHEAEKNIDNKKAKENSSENGFIIDDSQQAEKEKLESVRSKLASME